jgi:hypothetical protein
MRKDRPRGFQVSRWRSWTMTAATAGMAMYAKAKAREAGLPQRPSAATKAPARVQLSP